TNARKRFAARLRVAAAVLDAQDEHVVRVGGADPVAVRQCGEDGAEAFDVRGEHEPLCMPGDERADANVQVTRLDADRKAEVRPAGAQPYYLYGEHLRTHLGLRSSL
ncbi:MAG: hypothetical protein KGK18_01070, partial [Burkholderiales bacterium]|nr:hypothetical protein [Burkholderiales bacterium]